MEHDDAKGASSSQVGGASKPPEIGGTNETVLNKGVTESDGENKDTKENSCCLKGGGTCASVPGYSEMVVVNGQEGSGRAIVSRAFRECDGMLSHEQDDNTSSSTTARADTSHDLPTTTKVDRALHTSSDDELSNTHGGKAHSTTPGCVHCSTLLAKLHQEEQRCTVLRDNIHKVSANWFQRKTQLSESETEGDVSPVPLLSATRRVAEDEEDEGETSCGGVSERAINRSRDMTKLMSIIAQRSAQLDLSDSQCRELKKRMREYEKIIDDKEDIIHGLKEQLETYLTDNQNMSVQLNNLASLFHQLEKVDKETVSVPQPQEAEAEESATVPLPTQEDFQEMASSVSRTYIKLKDLIYEKKALVTEIERLNTLNVELQRRVLQQETRLMSVSDALHQTWLVVSDLKDQHAKLHDDELIMKYELKEKREILTKLRRELESARAQWQVIRQKNFESELEYTSIREMLQERRKAGQGEQTVNEEKQEGEEEPDEAVCLHPDDTKSFDPPVDLLLEMGLEYGIIGEDAEMTQTVLGLIRGEDIRNNRLEQLEEHCSLLYQKLLSSTSRSLSLASRLSRLHTQFSLSEDELDGEGDYLVEGEEEEEGDEEMDLEGEEGGEQIENSDQDEDEGEQETHYYSDANHLAVMESVLSSPDSEEYDTAYVSETEGQDVVQATRTTVDNIQELTESEPQAGPSEVQSILASDLTVDAEEACLSAELEENCDLLSRRLINFLPRKIEFLKCENKKLELSVLSLKEERERAENTALRLDKDKERLEEEVKGLTKDMTMEKLQRIQLEQQLKHLGKCVDELKLKHQAEKNAPAAASSKREQQQSMEEEPRTEEQGEEDDRGETETKKEEPREERSRENVQMKREVELVKKDMELKKKEKELRRKEMEMAKREQELEERVGGSSTARRENIAHPGEGASSSSQQPLWTPHGRPLVAPPPLIVTASGNTPPPQAHPATPLPTQAAAASCNITRVGELVVLLLQRVSASNLTVKENYMKSNAENCCTARLTPPNSTSLPIPSTRHESSREAEPPTVLSPSTAVCCASTTACYAEGSQDITQHPSPSDPLLDKITLEPYITSQALETRGPLVMETTVSADEFLIIPLQLTVSGQQVILRIHATQDSSLLVLQSETDPTAQTARSASALPSLLPRLLVPPFPIPPCGSCLRLTSRSHTITCLAVITTTTGTATARVTYSAALGSWPGEEGGRPTDQ